MMQRYTLYLYLETALHILRGTSTHHQEGIQLYLQHLVFVTPLLLSAAIVEEVEPVWHTQTGSNSSTIAADSSNGVTNTDAVDTVVCAPDDGWKYHPKYVKQFPAIHKLFNVESCWTYIGIYLQCTGP
jgi:hypothetical protein